MDTGEFNNFMTDYELIRWIKQLWGRIKIMIQMILNLGNTSENFLGINRGVIGLWLGWRNFLSWHKIWPQGILNRNKWTDTSTGYSTDNVSTFAQWAFEENWLNPQYPKIFTTYSTIHKVTQIILHINPQKNTSHEVIGKISYP